jgi:Xaa-Pro aminopeptidase
VIGRDGRATVVADNWLEAEARAAHADEAVVWNWYDLRQPAAERHATACAELARVLERRGVRSVAFEHGVLPRAALPRGCEPGGDLTAALARGRETKDPDELALVRRAIRATEAGHEAARRALRPGMREIDLHAEIEAAIARAAGEPVLLLCDLVAGARTGDRGGTPGTYAIREGDAVLVDLFPIVGGYRADITATLVAGEPTREQAARRERLHEALAAGEARLRPGGRAADVFEAVRGVLGSLPTHAGHGLGLDHPEPPFLVPGSDETLRAGAVIALEPGLYEPGRGGARIEHDYLVTVSGFERLSAHQT